MLRLLVTSTLLFFAPVAARADTPELTGLTKFNLAIEELSDDAKPCGITQDLIKDAFLSAASGAKFELIDDIRSTRFYVAVTTIRVVSVHNCASFIAAEVSAIGTVKYEHKDRSMLKSVIIWNDGYLFESDRDQHPGRVKKAVQDVTQRFITEWNLSNK